MIVSRSHAFLFALFVLPGCGGDSSSSDSGTSGDGTTDPTPSTTDDVETSATAPESTSGDPSATASSSSAPTTTAADTTGDSTTGEIDSGLELLVCSFVGDAVGRFDLDDGTFLGNLGPSEDLDGALGIVVGDDGRIYVASEESNMVLRFDGRTGAFVDRFVWDDPKTPANDESGGLEGPGAVLFGPDGDLYVSSFDSDAILRYDGTTGVVDDVFVPPGSGGLNGPDAGTVFGPDGDLYVPGYYSNTIPRFDGETGAYIDDFTPADMLAEPRTLVFAGEHMYVANEGSDEVLRFDAATGDFVDVFVEAGAGGLDAPAGMVFSPDGALHVASVNGNEVLRFDADGQPLPTLVDAIAGAIDAPTHITIAPALSD